MQDLIMTTYVHDPDAHDGLKRNYYHLVGKPGDVNNISFVAGCWGSLIEKGFLSNMDTIKVWSDNGPKHFKISANLRVFQAIQKARPNQDWVLNFFPGRITSLYYLLIKNITVTMSVMLLQPMESNK